MFDIMRDAYARTEVEIWGENYVRMPQDEYEGLIEKGRILVALWDDRIAGVVYSYAIDEQTSAFSLLGVHRDFEGKGNVGKLIEAAEKRA